MFGQRFASVPIDDEAHLLAAATYVVLNPVRAGLCARASDWPWSSYRASAGLTEMPTWLTPTSKVVLFDGDEADAKDRFQTMIDLRSEDLQTATPTRIHGDSPLRGQSPSLR